MRLVGFSRAKIAGAFVAAVVASVHAGACSSAGGPPSQFNQNPGGGGGGGGGPGGTSGIGGNPLLDAGDPDNMLTPDSACAAEPHKGELVPLDLYILLDRSSSMQDGAKWSSTVSALQTFISSPQSKGLGVGIQFFPLKPAVKSPAKCTTAAECGNYGMCFGFPPNQFCEGAMAPDVSCEQSDYEKPAVPIDTLPAAGQALLDAINKQSPQGSATPTLFAYRGALAYAVPWAQAHLDHVVAVILATDGEPNLCTGNTTANIAAKAEEAVKGTPKVLTFVVGVGTELAALNQIAQMGGTGQAFIVDTGGNVTQQFIDALNKIRASGVCEYQIPVPTSGKPDFNRLNVVFTKEGETTGTTIKKVADKASCDPTNGGWYYDDESNPKKILLCEASCNMVRNNAGQVDVMLGCQTVLA
jgi:hypothetical protein